MTTPTTPAPLVQQLRAAREHRGWTRDTLAAELGMSIEAISSWETGRRQPALDRLDAWAAALGHTITLTPRSPQ